MHRPKEDAIEKLLHISIPGLLARRLSPAPTPAAASGKRRIVAGARTSVGTPQNEPAIVVAPTRPEIEKFSASPPTCDQPLTSRRYGTTSRVRFAPRIRASSLPVLILWLEVPPWRNVWG